MDEFLLDDENVKPNVRKLNNNKLVSGVNSTSNVNQNHQNGYDSANHVNNKRKPSIWFDYFIIGQGHNSVKISGGATKKIAKKGSLYFSITTNINSKKKFLALINIEYFLLKLILYFENKKVKGCN